LIGFLLITLVQPLFSNGYEGTYIGFMLATLGILCLFVGIGVFIVALIYLIANLTD
jgi:hypothetical protein